MNRIARNRLAVLGLASLTLVQACARSPEFAKDQEYYKPESPYYDRAEDAGKTPTDRLEVAAQPKKKVLVFDLWNDTPVKAESLGPYAANELKRGFLLNQRFIVPKDVNSVLATEDFVSGDKIKVAQLIREGRRLGVSVVIVGRISKAIFRSRGDSIGLFRDKKSMAAVDVELKVFDVNAGKEVASMGRSADAASDAVVAVEQENLESESFRTELFKQALRNAMVGLAPDVHRVIEKMIWQGKIAKVNGRRIFVNAGKSAGIISGDILKVLTPGDDVYDPASGAYLGRSPGQLKGTVEVVDFIGIDAAIGEIHTGGNFSEGDIVQLY